MKQLVNSQKYEQHTFSFGSHCTVVEVFVGLGDAKSLDEALGQCKCCQPYFKVPLGDQHQEVLVFGSNPKV